MTITNAMLPRRRSHVTVVMKFDTIHAHCPTEMLGEAEAPWAMVITSGTKQGQYGPSQDHLYRMPRALDISRHFVHVDVWSLRIMHYETI